MPDTKSYQTRLWLPGLIGLLLISLTGCAATLPVSVNGYTDPAAVVHLAPGARFCVAENPQAPNPLLEREIKAKLERLLSRRGFGLAPCEQADFVMLFTYGIGPGAARTVISPEWSFGVGAGRFWHGGYVFFWPGFTTYSTAAVYECWVLLNVVAGRDYREKKTSRPLWVGEARSSGTTGDLRQAVDPLLVAALEKLGLNTGKAVTVELREDDPRLRDLKRP
ncbi:MAG: hypothetical protein K6T55_02370 [Syntrophobacterales bacterium]|nr:hypothetical protein [Syntrophobacterales bacterium]